MITLLTVLGPSLVTSFASCGRVRVYTLTTPTSPYIAARTVICVCDSLQFSTVYGLTASIEYTVINPRAYQTHPLCISSRYC